jgi:hypothetical protein
MCRDPRNAVATFKDAMGDLRTDLGVREEARSRRFRSTRQIKGSEHPGVVWPAPPPRRAPKPSPGPIEPPTTTTTTTTTTVSKVPV